MRNEENHDDSHIGSKNGIWFYVAGAYGNFVIHFQV